MTSRIVGGILAILWLAMITGMCVVYERSRSSCEEACAPEGFTFIDRVCHCQTDCGWQRPRIEKD